MESLGDLISMLRAVEGDPWDSSDWFDLARDAAGGKAGVHKWRAIGGRVERRGALRGVRRPRIGQIKKDLNPIINRNERLAGRYGRLAGELILIEIIYGAINCINECKCHLGY